MDDIQLLLLAQRIMHHGALHVRRGVLSCLKEAVGLTFIGQRINVVFCIPIIVTDLDADATNVCRTDLASRDASFTVASAPSDCSHTFIFEKCHGR